jgi:hypothetical protein
MTPRPLYRNELAFLNDPREFKDAASGPARGVYAPSAFPTVNPLSTAVLCGHAGRVAAKKRRFPARAVRVAAGGRRRNPTTTAPRRWP